MYEHDDISEIPSTARIHMKLEIQNVLRELLSIQKKVDGFYLEDSVCADTSEPLNELDGALDEIKMSLSTAINSAEEALEPFKAEKS